LVNRAAQGNRGKLSLTTRAVFPDDAF